MVSVSDDVGSSPWEKRITWGPTIHTKSQLWQLWLFFEPQKDALRRSQPTITCTKRRLLIHGAALHERPVHRKQLRHSLPGMGASPKRETAQALAAVQTRIPSHHPRSCCLGPEELDWVPAWAQKLSCLCRPPALSGHIPDATSRLAPDLVPSRSKNWC